MSTWCSILSRRKPIPTISIDDKNTNQLARVLTTLDLTFLGVGSTLGVGVYVLAGHVAKETAGPAVVLSFLIAAVASAFAGLCYAEFGARVPRAGSAYIYSYVSVGEFIAFIIGWNLILEYVIGSASVAKAMSVYLDTLLNNTLKNSFIEIAPINSSFMSEYFDFFSFTVSILLGAALAFGLKESSLVNNLFTSLNIFVVLFVVIAGAIKANPNNWSIQKNSTMPEIGEGGFFPFGVEGVIKGAATCFYGFVGFDCIATTGEEVKNPKRAIPISIILSLFIIFLAYFGTSTVITLMVPYYLQDSNAPIPHAFDAIGWSWAKWIVSIGGIFGLCASLFGAMFPLPRVIYAMATDALVFRFLGTVNERFKTPVVGTLLAALLTGLMSALFNLTQLVNMMSIGTLMAYTIVAACVIILRYNVTDEEIADWHYSLLQPEIDDTEDEYSEVGHTYEQNGGYTENLNLIPPHKEVSMAAVFKNLFNLTNKKASYLTQRIVTILVFIFCILSLILACLLSYLQSDLIDGELHAVIPTAITVFIMLVALFAISAQPTVKSDLSFKVPLVPLIPALSICINIYLMLMLDVNTWIRFGVWMAVGLPIYFTARKLYSTINQPTTNGHVNTGFTPEKLNGKSLTIPEITVDPPSIVDCKSDVGSETNEKYLRERTLSVDSNAINNAVLELDKVLDESENDYINFEAINPENEYKNTSILTKLDDTFDANSLVQSNFDQNDNTSISSSNSGSIHSKEHHIEAQIHQEDETISTTIKTIEPIRKDSEISNNETKKDSITTTNKTIEHQDKATIQDQQRPITRKHSEMDNETKPIEVDNNVTNFKEPITNDGIPHPPPIQPLLDACAVDNETKDTISTTIGEPIINEGIPPPPPIQPLLDACAVDNETKDTISTNIGEPITNEGIPPPPPIQPLLDNNETKELKQKESIRNEGIPSPPPMQPLLDQPSPKLSPPKAARPKFTPQNSVNLSEITAENLGSVVLRPIPKKTRTVSTSSEGPIENVKAGSLQYSKIKNKLDVIFKNRVTSPSDRKYYVEEKQPSPNGEKEIEVFDKVIEQFEEEIPANFGKTKEFKDELSNLLLRRKSQDIIDKPEFVQKYEKNQNNTKTDQLKHKKLMADSLQTIRLRKNETIGETNSQSIVDESKRDTDQNTPEKDQNTLEKDQSTLEKDRNKIEKDKDKHKRLMNATLRSIQLRRTGLNLNEDSLETTDNNVER